MGPAPALTRAIQDRIGNELRAMYEASSSEPVPLRIIELMNRLEKTTPARRS
jgi:Anti-sigma factor NepR